MRQFAKVRHSKMSPEMARGTKPNRSQPKRIQPNRIQQCEASRQLSRSDGLMATRLNRLARSGN